MTAIPLDQILKLSVEDRLQLAEEIWDSIRANPDVLPLTDAQRTELDRRRAAYKADPSSTVDLDEAVSRLRNRK